MLPQNYQPSLDCAQKAAQILGWPFHFVDEDKVLLEVQSPTQKLHFLHNKNPFNSYISSRICQDKSLQYQLYTQNQISTPPTFSYHNPNQPESFQKYIKQTSIPDIINHIEANLQYPLIIKKNISSLSRDVHQIPNQNDLKSILSSYFSTSEPLIILAQKFITGQEYRLVQLNGELLLAYNKNNHKFTQQNPLPPQKIQDPKLLSQFSEITQQIHSILQINFSGIDVILDQNKKIWVIETNPNPAQFYYNKHNGSDDFIQVYLQCFQQYQS